MWDLENWIADDNQWRIYEHPDEFWGTQSDDYDEDLWRDDPYDDDYPEIDD